MWLITTAGTIARILIIIVESMGHHANKEDAKETTKKEQ